MKLSCKRSFLLHLSLLLNFAFQNLAALLLNKVSKETVVLRQWEYYKIIWFYQLSQQCKFTVANLHCQLS